MCFAIYANNAVLDLALQARGYGFLFLCSISISILLLIYFEKRKFYYLVLIGIITVLGTWTIPVFIFFSGVVILFTYLITKDNKIFLLGCVAFTLILLLYIPIIGDILYQLENYSEVWGKQYSSINSVSITIKRYLIPKKDWLIFLVLFGMVFYSQFAYLNNDKYKSS